MSLYIGFKHSEETKRRIREATIKRHLENKNFGFQKNHKEGMFGKRHSEKTKEKLRKFMKGKHHSAQTEFKKGHIPWIKNKTHSKAVKIKLSKILMGLRGEQSRNWKNGITYASGYRFIYQPEHPYSTRGKRYVREHRIIMEKYLDRYLNPEEVVHHINNIPSDNRIENLILFNNNKEHIRHHYLICK